MFKKILSKFNRNASEVLSNSPKTKTLIVKEKAFFNELLNLALSENLQIKTDTEVEPSFFYSLGLNVPIEEFDKLLELHDIILNKDKPLDIMEEHFYIYNNELHQIVETIGIVDNVIATIKNVKTNELKKIKIDSNKMLTTSEVNIIKKYVNFTEKI